MQKKIEIYQVDAFTDKPFGGNPAGVTISEDLSKDEMQLISKEMNLAETAFLSKPDLPSGRSDKADYNLRWFTPATEVNLCGHATIASLHFLNEKKLIKNSSVKFDTLSGVLKCGIKDEKYFMQIPIFSMKEYDENKEEILEVLGITKSEIEDSSPFILLENGYLYIHIKKLKTIKNIKPDFKSLLRLAKGNKAFDCVTIFTLETIDKGSFANLRFFAPSYGIDEDPVTGSANGPLLLVLKRLGFIKDSDEEISVTFEQGDFMNRRGRVTVTYNGKSNELYISGNAVTVLKGEMIF